MADIFMLPFRHRFINERKTFRTIKFSLPLLTLIFVVLNYMNMFSIIEKSKASTRHEIQEEHPEYLVKTEGCRIQSFDPFHPSVAKYLKPPNDELEVCHKGRYLKIYGDRIVLDTVKVWNDFGTTDFNCFYQPIVSASATNRFIPSNKSMDFIAYVLEAKHLIFGRPMTDEFMRISCYKKGIGKLFRDYVALPLIKPQVESEREPAAEENLSEKPLNVILLAIDSVSKLNFIRQFPKTLEFLKTVLRPFEFHGHTKVADNTFVNIVPLLTGRFVSEYRVRSNVSNTYYDDLDFVWKEYASAGYRTFYAEDDPRTGTFVLGKKGFESPPTDYYLRPFALTVESKEWRDRYGRLCFGHTSEPEFYYDYLLKFLEAMDTRPSFSFTFVSRATHDFLNEAMVLDEPTVNLLQNLYGSGILNQSALIFFSDHGIRFGDILNTYIGKMEERMPFMFQYYPDWFLKKYPDVAESLRVNQRRLTTPFDVHKTMQDILSLSVKENHKNFGLFSQNKSTGHGQSLFKEIPTTRTCADASIHPHWCTCHDRKEIPKDDPRAVEAARVMIQTINEWTNSTSETNDSLCSKLSVTDIVDAYITPPSEEEIRRAKEDPQKLEFQDPEYFRRKEKEVLEEEQGPLRASDIKWSSETFLVSARAEPGYGVFEGTLMNIGGEFVVLGDISRINRYGDQSWCVQDPVLKKYCYCKVAKENDDDNRIRRRRKKREVVMNKIPEVTPFKKD